MLNKSLLLFIPVIASAQLIEQQIPIAPYGWLDQFSVSPYSLSELSCVPTVSTNAMTYLQNTSPAIFGQSLSGSTYNDWLTTDNILINLTGTTNTNGTYEFPYAVSFQNYFAAIKQFPNVQFSGIYLASQWNSSLNGLSVTNPNPSYIEIGTPTISFLSNAIAAGSAVVAHFYTPAGHVVLVNGLTWDTATQSGQIFFIDPLDPSQNYSSSNPSVVEGPVKQSSGTLYINAQGLLELQYNQYDGNLDPYDPSNYIPITATIQGLLSIGGATYAPFATLLPSGNTHAIAKGFDKLDPTTAAMFPVLAVLNTLSDPSPDFALAFEQMDPSPMNDTFYAEQAVGRQIQAAVQDHLLSYLRLCTFDSCEPPSKNAFWMAPLGGENIQRGKAGSFSHSGYKDTLYGGVLGYEHCFANNVVLGTAAAYAHSRVTWTTAQAKSSFNSWEGVIYTQWVECPWLVKADVGYIYNRVGVDRWIFSDTDNPFIPPIQESFSHHINSNACTADLGLGYEVYEKKWKHSAVQLWPFLDVNYEYVHQPSYSESGPEPLALHVNQQSSHLLLPSAGLGCNAMIQGKKANFSAYAALSYAREIRFGGKSTTAYFIHNPDTQFTVSGLFPQNNLFCPMLQLSVSSPCERYQFRLAYQGAYGSRFTSNSGSAEFAFMF